MKINNDKKDKTHVTISPTDTKLIQSFTILIRELKELVLCIIILIVIFGFFFS